MDFQVLKGHVKTMPIQISDRPRRSVLQAMRRGFAQRCPQCGKGALFWKYLKVNDSCSYCAEALHHHRADDAPAYFTIVIVGHLIVGGILALHKSLAPPEWVQLAIWLPLTLLSCLWLLPRVKGALVGLQWALYMHGFDHAEARDQPVEP